MSKKTIVILSVCGVVLFLTGIVILAIGALRGGFNEIEFEMKTFSSNNATDNLVVEINAGKCEIVYTNDDFVKVEYPSAPQYVIDVVQYSDSIHVEGPKSPLGIGFIDFGGILGGFKDIPTTKIFLPKNTAFQLDLTVNAGLVEISDGSFGKVKLQINAGELRVGEIACTSFGLRMSAGAATLNSVTTNTCEMVLTAGSVNLSKLDCATTTDISLSAGAVTLKLAGTQQDYNVAVKVTAGTCNLMPNTALGSKRCLDVRLTAGSVAATFLGN